MREQVANRPKRVHDLLAKDIELLNQRKFNGRLPFTQASAEYVAERRQMEEELAKLRRIPERGDRSRLI